MNIENTIGTRFEVTDIAEGKNEFLKQSCLTFIRGNVIAKPGIVNPIKIRY